MTCTVYQIWPRIHCLPCRANPFPSMINFIVAVDIIIPLFCTACCSGPVCNSGEVELLGSIQRASAVIRFREVASLVSSQNTFLELACSVLLYNAWEWIIFIIITVKYIRIRAITDRFSGVTIIQANDYTWSCWITLSKKKGVKLISFTHLWTSRKCTSILYHTAKSVRYHHWHSKLVWVSERRCGSETVRMTASVRETMSENEWFYCCKSPVAVLWSHLWLFFFTKVCHNNNIYHWAS